MLEDLRQGRIESLNRSIKYWSGPLPGQPESFTTAADGRIRLTGFGSDRFVSFQVEGTGIATKLLEVITRPGEPVVLDEWHQYYGSEFEHLAKVSRPIRGIVRDQVTGKPVAGVEISAFGLSLLHKTHTDNDGRYELLGLPKSQQYNLTVRPANGQLYFAGDFSLADTPGLDPLPADIKLVSGIPLRGRVTDKATGQPVAQAQVEYRLLYPNPEIKKLADFPGSYGPRSEATTAADGTFTLVVLPGPGVLGVTASKQELYMPALVTPKDLKDFFKDKLDLGGAGQNENALNVAVQGNSMSFIVQQNYNALVLLDPDEKATALTREVALEPARTLNGSVVGPDGKPLTGVVVYGLTWQGTELLKSDAFTVRAINPRRPRPLLFLHKEKNLGFYTVLKGDEPEPLTIRLQPCGSATGRIIDKDKQPVADIRLSIQISGLSGLHHNFEFATNRDGRFRAEGLVPGAKYWLSPSRRVVGIAEVVVEPGKNKDLGDLDGHVGENP